MWPAGMPAGMQSQGNWKSKPEDVEHDALAFCAAADRLFASIARVGSRGVNPAAGGLRSAAAAIGRLYGRHPALLANLPAAWVAAATSGPQDATFTPPPQASDWQQKAGAQRGSYGVPARETAPPPPPPPSVPRSERTALDEIVGEDPAMEVPTPLMGKRVTVVGTSRQDLNGQGGRAVSIDEFKGRYHVQLDGGETISLKPENLEEAPETEPLDAQGVWQQTERDTSTGKLPGGLRVHVERMHDFLKNDDIAGAYEELALLRHDGRYVGGIQPINDILNAHMRTSDLESAESLLQGMEKNWGVKPSVASYNAVIKTCELAPERAESWLSAMIADGVNPDTTSFNTVIKAWGRVGDVGKAEQWLETIDDDQADATSFTTVMMAYAQIGNVARSEHWLRAMPDRGVQPDIAAHGAMVLAHCRNGDTAGATLWLEHIRNAGLKPDSQVYSPLIHAYAQEGDAGGMERILGQVRDGGVVLDQETQNAAATCLGDERVASVLGVSQEQAWKRRRQE